MQETVKCALKQPNILEVWIYRGADGSCSFYNDDGISYDYKKCMYENLKFEWDDAGKRITIRAYSRSRNAPTNLQIHCGSDQKSASFIGRDITALFE